MKKIFMSVILSSIMFGSVEVFDTANIIKDIFPTEDIAQSNGGEKEDYVAFTDGIGLVVFTPTHQEKQIDNEVHNIAINKFLVKAKEENKTIEEYLDTHYDELPTKDKIIVNRLSENPVKNLKLPDKHWQTYSLEPDMTYSTTCNWNRDDSNPNLYHNTGQFSTIHFVLPTSGKMKITVRSTETSIWGGYALIGSRPDIYPICNKHAGTHNSNTNMSKYSGLFIHNTTDTFIVDLDNKTVYIESDPTNIKPIPTYSDGIITFTISDGTSGGTGSVEILDVQWYH